MDDDLSTAPPDNDNVFSDSLSDSSFNFDETLKEELNPTDYKRLRTIGAFLIRGLSLEESCVLARAGIEKLRALMDANEDVRNFILFKQISYKAELLNTLSASAIQGRQAKSAGYLLEKKYPKEFDNKAGEGEKQLDVFEKAISYIRTNGDHRIVYQLDTPK